MEISVLLEPEALQLGPSVFMGFLYEVVGSLEDVWFHLLILLLILFVVAKRRSSFPQVSNTHYWLLSRYLNCVLYFICLSNGLDFLRDFNLL